MQIYYSIGACHEVPWIRDTCQFYSVLLFSIMEIFNDACQFCLVLSFTIDVVHKVLSPVIVSGM